MGVKTMNNNVCWICMSAHTSDNPVVTVNCEDICQECMGELADISREKVEEKWLALLKRA
jgi:hypothetical protein